MQRDYYFNRGRQLQERSREIQIRNPKQDTGEFWSWIFGFGLSFGFRI
jgi:hypothetical protein